jgi:DNA-binding IclR family transcriptional regulator
LNNTLLKGLSVLELLSHSDRALSLTQIAASLGMAKSNVHRLMQALTSMRYVLKDDATAVYAPSIKLWELGSAVLAKLDLRRHAQRQMETLLESTGESVHLSVLDRGEVVYVHKVESLNPVRAYTQIGGRAPAYCVATGKAQLAYVGEATLLDISRRLQRHTPHTVTDPALFLKQMAKVREQGHAVNRGEWRAGVWGVATPVMDARGTVIAAIGISGPAERFRRRDLRECAEILLLAASDISDALGGNPHFGALRQIVRTPS